MEIKVPSYWQEEKYQPMIEAETAYGNKVKIPQILLENWEEIARLKGRYPKDVEQARAVGFFRRTTHNRVKRDTLLVYYEEFRE